MKITHAQLADVLGVAPAALHARRKLGQAPTGTREAVDGSSVVRIVYDVAAVRAWLRAQRDATITEFKACDARLREITRGMR